MRRIPSGFLLARKALARRMARPAPESPRPATIPLVVDATDHWAVLSPLTGRELVQPGTPCA